MVMAYRFTHRTSLDADTNSMIPPTSSRPQLLDVGFDLSTFNSLSYPSYHQTKAAEEGAEM